MSLVSRLSLFFLAALGIVLIGFSLSLYFLARTHLDRQVNDRAEAALDVLTATAEIEPDGLEWDTRERSVPLAVDTPGAAIDWGVFDRMGGHIAGTSETFTILVRDRGLADAAGPAKQDVEIETKLWRVARRTLFARPPGETLVPDDPARHRYQVLVLAGAVPIDPMRRSLQTLLGVLAGISLVAWTTAAVAGRWLGRRSLEPVARMARGARAITAADLSARLPDPGTGDELADLAAAFNDLLTRFQSSYERQERFAGEASHQLRTPLTALLGHIDVALRRDRPPAEYRQTLSSLRTQTGRLTQIVEALLFLARADADAALPATEPFDLRAWLVEHLETWDGHPRRRDMRMESAAEADFPVVGHPTLLGQALDNLLDNACKYSPPGSPIELRLGRAGDRVCLEVRDHGPGVTATDLPHVFDPFFRSPDVRQRGLPGLGLGLAVTRRIVAALGGRIDVESEPGQGCRFVVWLNASDPILNRVAHATSLAGSLAASK